MTPMNSTWNLQPPRLSPRIKRTKQSRTSKQQTLRMKRTKKTNMSTSMRRTRKKRMTSHKRRRREKRRKMSGRSIVRLTRRKHKHLSPKT